MRETEGMIVLVGGLSDLALKDRGAALRQCGVPSAFGAGVLCGLTGGLVCWGARFQRPHRA